jgi:hypothetical protein
MLLGVDSRVYFLYDEYACSEWHSESARQGAPLTLASSEVLFAAGTFS